MKSMIVDGVKYVPESTVPKGNRAVVVVNRGWIYAGDVEEKDGRILLHRAVWVFGWKGIGFSEVLRNPQDDNVDIRQVDQVVDIPAHSEVYRVTVSENWGLS